MGDRILELDDKVKTNSAISAVAYPRVHGFVYDDGEALAVYWGAIYVGHPEHAEPRVDLTIALGQDWSEGSDASHWKTQGSGAFRAASTLVRYHPLMVAACSRQLPALPLG
jgi:hypothetical protein